MNYKKRLASDAVAKEILDAGEYGIMATVDEAGNAYGVPLSYVRDGDAIYFHCAKKGYKLDNIKTHPQVTFTVVIDTRPTFENTFFSTYYKSVIASGNAAEVVDEVEKRNALRLLCEKLVPSAKGEIEGAIDRGIAGTAVYRIDVSEMSAKVADSIG